MHLIQRKNENKNLLVDFFLLLEKLIIIIVFILFISNNRETQYGCYFYAMFSYILAPSIIIIIFLILQSIFEGLKKKKNQIGF